MAMKEIDIREVKENLVHLLADEWALVTAGRGYHQEWGRSRSNCAPATSSTCPRT